MVASLGTTTVGLGANTTAFNANMRAAQSRMRSFGSEAARATRHTAVFVATLALGSGAIGSIALLTLHQPRRLSEAAEVWEQQLQ